MAAEELNTPSPAPVVHGNADARPVAKPSRRISRGTKVLLGIILVAVALYAARYPFMSAAAKEWVVNDDPIKSDVIVVLGGGLDSRPSFAANLYRRGLASIVLVSDVRHGPAVEKGIIPSETAIAITLLEKEGVPASAIQTFGNRVNSTRDESQGVLAWVREHPSHRIIVPTDPFHTRRVKWVFARDLKQQHVEVSVPSIPTSRYDIAQWWKSEEATINFQNEIIKLIYYWMHY